MSNLTAAVAAVLALGAMGGRTDAGQGHTTAQRLRARRRGRRS